MRKSSLQTAKPKIAGFFAAAGKKVFTPTDIRKIFDAHHAKWKLAASISLAKFKKFLLENTPIEKVRLEFPNRPFTRYVWGKQPTLELAHSISPSGYFSHYTAMSLHELTDQIPKRVFLNTEQTPKPRNPGELVQDRIDWAFKRNARTTNNKAQYQNSEIYLVNGMNTKNMGVLPNFSCAEGNFPVTGIERTLIDIAVRPFYSGGIFEVRQAFKKAIKKVNTDSLVEMLKKLNYIYPYHQVIGCYLDKAGYPPKDLDKLKRLGLDYDFYITYKIGNPIYINEWRLFVPNGF